MVERRKEMKRYEEPNHLRFLTFSCYRQLPLFEQDWAKATFADVLQVQRKKCRFHLIAWVVMTDHAHLLLWPNLPEYPVSKVLWGLKRDVARRVAAGFRDQGSPMLEQMQNPRGQHQFWQRGGGHDRNIFSEDEIREKIDYINMNPVRKGLVETPVDWAWSSARWYAGDRDSGIPIDPIRRPD